MTKANSKKYFPQCIAKISFRKVDAWAVRMAKHFPYFDTWQEAHDFMRLEAEKDVILAKKKLASATRHAAKVSEMQEPLNPEAARLSGITKE